MNAQRMSGIIIVVGAMAASALGQECQWMLRGSGPMTGLSAMAMAYDSSRERSVMFGGHIVVGGPIPGVITAPLRETWEWDGKSWMMRSDIGPLARSNHAMAYDSSRGVTMLFGGRHLTSSQDIRFNDLWEWDGIEWVERHPGGSGAPNPRHSFAMIYDSHRDRLVVFGGQIVGSRDGETWEWNGKSWEHRVPAGSRPSARYGHAMAFDVVRGRTVLFGGFDGTRRDDTWEWDGVQWMLQQPPLRPSARFRHAMAYDTARGRTVLFGGNQTNAGNNETWVREDAHWTLMVGAGHEVRMDHAMVYDIARDRVVQFGGEYTNQVWELQCTPVIPPCYANCDGSTVQPILNIDDFTCFISEFAAGVALPQAQQVSHYANCDMSTVAPVLNIDDFTCFVEKFAAGCP